MENQKDRNQNYNIVALAPKFFKVVINLKRPHPKVKEITIHKKMEWLFNLN